MTDAHVHLDEADLAARGSCIANSDAFAILSHCHEHILEKLEVLEDVGRELATDGAFTERRLAMLCDVLTMLDTAIPLHTADEEETLFPVLRATEIFAGMDATPMDCIEYEHDGHRQLMVDLKREVMKRDGATTARAAMAIVEEYRSHIQKEEEVVYPWARELVDGASLVRMATVMRQRRVDAGILKAC